MSNATTAARTVKPAARPRLLGIRLAITDARGQLDSYRIFVLPGAADGSPAAALRFEKQTGDRAAYTVAVDRTGRRSCDCMGHLRHHNCKHSDAAMTVARVFRLFAPPLPTLTAAEAEGKLFGRPAGQDVKPARPEPAAPVVPAEAPGVVTVAAAAPAEPAPVAAAAPTKPKAKAGRRKPASSTAAAGLPGPRAYAEI